jgi:hypothetical protein
VDLGFRRANLQDLLENKNYEQGEERLGKGNKE